jgi:hypothetical protein
VPLEPGTGVLMQTWNFDERVTTLEFSCDGLYLHTNLGSIGIQYRGDILMSRSPYVCLDISSKHIQWLKLNGQRVLWLPSESRPSQFQIKGNIVALGLASGRVSFVGFCM